MWLLESDGDVFKGKRLWLRPGKKFIFGRTSAEASGFVIENKTISRKHLTVQVANVNPGDGLLPWARSQIVLEDLNTKMGTQVNGTQIRGQRYILQSSNNEIKLGQYEKTFRIIWNPVVLSFSFTSKELKSNPLAKLSSGLESLDIKFLVEYIRESTTHVVASKRNTSKGLQALINGKYIVDSTYIDAIVNVSHSEGDQVSNLEMDFDLYWPNALEHLPPRGQEPTELQDDEYSPIIARQEVFDGYTFVFYNESQFENLLAPITNGRGKALLRQVDPQATTIDDFVRYAKDVAGEKGLGEFEDGSEGKGVVIVKYQPSKGPASEWYNNFSRQVALRLDHRLVEQNEFLGAILSNDASVLRKPLETEPSDLALTTAIADKPLSPGPSSHICEQDPDMSQRPEGAAPDLSQLSGSVPPEAVPAPIAPPRRMGRSRRAITSRFRGFDDNFDNSIGNDMTHRFMQVDQPQMQETELFLSQNPEEQVGNLPQSALIRAQAGRKRSSPVIEEEATEDIMEQLAPAALNFKRRRLAQEATRKQVADVSTLETPVVAEITTELPRAKTKKAKTEIDVLEIARQNMEKEEAIARAKCEALQADMDDMNVEKIRNLAVIEDMEIKRTFPYSHSYTHGDEGNRWNERWNGRKDFKKFQRRGDGNQRPLDKVIVPLEEVKKKDFGIGDEYWLESREDDQRRRERGRPRRDRLVSQAQSQPQTGKGFAVEEYAPNDPSTLSQKAAKLRGSLENVESLQSLRPPNKRAAEPTARPEPVKRVRQVVPKEDSDESDDGLGFRFRKK